MVQDIEEVNRDLEQIITQIKQTAVPLFPNIVHHWAALHPEETDFEKAFGIESAVVLDAVSPYQIWLVHVEPEGRHYIAYGARADMPVDAYRNLRDVMVDELAARDAEMADEETVRATERQPYDVGEWTFGRALREGMPFPLPIRESCPARAGGAPECRSQRVEGEVRLYFPRNGESLPDRTRTVEEKEAAQNLIDAVVKTKGKGKGVDRSEAGQKLVDTLKRKR